MRAPLVVSLLGALALSACGPTVDLTKGLEVLDVSTGWKDVGIQADGNNKLVPALSFKLKNISDQPLRTLRVNAVFKQVGTDEEFGAEYVVVSQTQADALVPGAESRTITVKSTLGYTGVDSRADLLKHSGFVDRHAVLSVKNGSVQWIPIGDYPIERRLLAP
jgi:hypothetical protein